MTIYNIINQSTDLKADSNKPFSRAIEKVTLIVSAGGSAPIPTMVLLDDFFDFNQIEMQVTFDQDVVGFTAVDITAVENLPGSFGPGSIFSFTVNSPSSYTFVWESNDDGSGGDIDFSVGSAICTSSVGSIDNVASNVVNVLVMGF